MGKGFGLDFGTSNSAMGYVTQRGVQLAGFDGRPYLPSAIFFDEEADERAFGQDALSRYMEGTQGRMIWSPKNALGSSLMFEKTAVSNEMMSFGQIIGAVIEHIDQSCREQSDLRDVDSVVCGRPVRFSDTDDELDSQAQDLLEEVLRGVGFKNIVFEYEPIGASIAYAQQIDREQIALIVDMGGGTSDFTVVRLTPGLIGEGHDDAILSIGGVHIAGTTFDMRLSLRSLMPELGMGTMYKSMLGKPIRVPTRVFHQLASWHKINFAYTPKSVAFAEDVLYGAYDVAKISRLVDVLDARYGHALAKLVEAAKIDMTTNAQATLTTDGLDDDFSVSMNREDFEDAIADEIARIRATLTDTIQRSGVAPAAIDVVFMTGGSSKVPIVREAITEAMPDARLFDGDTFGSVASGLTLLASRYFG